MRPFGGHVNARAWITPLWQHQSAWSRSRDGHRCAHQRLSKAIIPPWSPTVSCCDRDFLFRGAVTACAQPRSKCRNRPVVHMRLGTASMARSRMPIASSLDRAIKPQPSNVLASNWVSFLNSHRCSICHKSLVNCDNLKHRTHVPVSPIQGVFKALLRLVCFK